MNIVILTQYYPPDLPGVIPSTVAHEMKKRGHIVRVVTALPNYAQNQETAMYSRQKRIVEIYDGIEVMRVPIVRSHSRNPIGRIANYVSFIISARAGNRFATDADVIYVHGTPATAAEPARAWHNSLGVPFVYHVQDIWPDSVIESGFLPRPLLRSLRFLLNKWLVKIYTSAAAVVAIAPTAKSLLIERGVPEGNAHLVYNYFPGESGQGPEFAGGTTLLYAGNLGDFQDLETVIRAAATLKHLPDFRLQIAGDGVLEASLKALVDRLDASDAVSFLGRIAEDRIPELYRTADFHVVPLKNIDIFAGTVPSKFQAGLAHGLPVITSAPGDVSRMVNDNELGFTAAPENVEEMAAAFLAAYNTTREERMTLSGNARSFYDRMFTKQSAMDQIESILQGVVDGNSTS